MTVFTGPTADPIRTRCAGPYPVEAGPRAHEEHLGQTS
jgi:hypothetical protein